MEDPVVTPQETESCPIDLGVALGQLQAFGTVSSRCDSAGVALLAVIREQKLYKSRCEHWDQFCVEHLKISRAEADRRIALWREFGARYFDVAQYATISSDTFRRLDPFIHDGALHLEDGVIPLIPENGPRIAGFLNQFKRKSPAAEPPPSTTGVFAEIEELQSGCNHVLEQFHTITRRVADTNDQGVVTTTLYNMATRLITNLKAVQFNCGGRPTM